MKLNICFTLVKPSQEHKPLIDQIGIKEMVVEDVASFEFDDNNLRIHYNNRSEETIPLRSNDGVDGLDWRFASIQVIRKFLEIDMNK